jgi:hypothetical protein
MPKLAKHEVRWIGSLGLLALLALGTSGCSRARSNIQVASDVQNRIRTDARMQMARVRVLVTGGVVTLSGYVTSNDQRAATVQDASQVKDVRLVIDNLRVVEAQPHELQPLETQAHEPQPQSQDFAAQKPSAGVTRTGITRSVKSTAGRPPAPIILKSEPARDTKPAAPQHRPAAQTTTVGDAASPAVPPAIASVPATPERHAIASTIPASSAGIVPVSVSTNSMPLHPVPAERIDIPNGTELVVRLTESLSSEVNEKGDTFLASLASPIMIGNRVVIPADAGVEGKVVEVENAGRFSGRPRLAIQMTRLTYNGNIYDLRSSQYAKQGASRDVRSIATIGGGAGVGAIIGGILGGGRGAAIGSIIGAGAGTGAQATSKAPQVKLPAETVLSVRLQSPLSVIPSETLQRAPNRGPGDPQDPFSSDADRPVLKRRPGSAPPEPDADATTHSDNK